MGVGLWGLGRISRLDGVLGATVTSSNPSASVSGVVRRRRWFPRDGSLAFRI